MGRTVCSVAMHITLCNLECTQRKCPPPPRNFFGEDLRPSHHTALSCASFILKYNGKNIANVMWTPSTQSLVHRAMYLQLSSRCWYQIYPLQSSHPAVLQTDFSNYTCIMKIDAKCKHFAFSFSKLEDAIISLW